MKKLCVALFALIVFGSATLSLCDADNYANDDKLGEKSVMILKS